jgi:hypothetical protein
MVATDYEAEDSEYYYEGSLPVLAGRFRRKLVGYFNGNIPPGTRIGREIRLVKLPQLIWVYGYLIRDDEHGVVLYIPNGALLPGVEGFCPVQLGGEIRPAQPITSKLSPHRSNRPDPRASDIDEQADDPPGNVEIEDICGIPGP